MDINLWSGKVHFSWNFLLFVDFLMIFLPNYGKYKFALSENLTAHSGETKYGLLVGNSLTTQNDSITPQSYE